LLQDELAEEKIRADRDLGDASEKLEQIRYAQDYSKNIFTNMFIDSESH
jgi:hypothetical protein